MARKELEPWKFALAVLLELWTSTAAVLLLTDLSASTIHLIYIITTWLRVFPWLYISWGLVGWGLWKYYMNIDNLSVLGACAAICYSYLQKSSKSSDDALAVPVIVHYWILIFFLNGHFRVLLTCVKWTELSLTLYRMNRAYAPMFYLVISLMSLDDPPKSLNKELFVTFLVTSVAYLLEFSFTISRVSKADTFETTMEFVTDSKEDLLEESLIREGEGKGVGDISIEMK